MLSLKFLWEAYLEILIATSLFIWGGGREPRWNMPRCSCGGSKNNLRESSSLFSLLWVLGIKSKSSDLEQKPSLRQGHSNQGLRRQGLSSQGLSRQGFSRGAFARRTFFFSWKLLWNSDPPVSVSWAYRHTLPGSFYMMLGSKPGFPKS